ncbi:hypothetical protein BDZ89DRAFT_190077 [Hymenopellis radicata]|nr:hypothetical protein BDZ89DRAFT_190077 [Hymenopellis radicata]
MEHLSDVILRSHTILTIFDRDRFQFEYFDRSVIAVSSAVDLSTEEGQTLFILMVYSLRRLSPEDLGLRNVVQDAWNLCTESASNRDDVPVVAAERVSTVDYVLVVVGTP